METTYRLAFCEVRRRLLVSRKALESHFAKCGGSDWMRGLIDNHESILALLDDIESDIKSPE
jgi:hypothetical protein